MLEMLQGIGIDFETAYPGFFKDGTFARRKAVERLLTDDELSAIPEPHRPTGPVVRTEIHTIAGLRFRSVINRVEFVFDGAEPESKP